MHANTLQVDTGNLQKALLQQNRLFLDAVKRKLPLHEILKRYDVVKELFDTIQTLQDKRQHYN